MLSILKNRNFRLFWIGQSISLIGTWAQNLALAWLAATIVHSAFWVGIICIAQFLPLLFFSLQSGCLIDRYSALSIFRLSQILTMAAAIVLAAAAQMEILTFWGLFGIAWLIGLGNTFDLPARQALLSELVEPAAVNEALRLNSLIFNLARVLGPVVAAVVIRYLDIGICFIINAVSFFPIIIITTRLHPIHSNSIIPEPPDFEVIPKGIKHCWHYAVKTKSIFIGLILLATTNTFALLYILMPLYMQNTILAGPAEFGMIFAANSLGACFASLLSSVIHQKTPAIQVLFFMAFAIAGLEIIMVSFQQVGLVYIAMGLIGLAMALFDIKLKSLLQTETPPGARGRMMSLYVFVFMGLSPLNMVGYGILAGLWGAPVALIVGAAIHIFGMIYLIYKFSGFKNRRYLLKV